MYIKRNFWQLPPDDVPLIAIADAMWHESENMNCAVYFVLLRPVLENKAWILEPIVVPGKENPLGWDVAFDNIPQGLKTRIKALVCDGAPHLRIIGRQNNWHVQQCHFHLVARIKNYIGTSQRSRTRDFGRMIMETVYRILKTDDENELLRLLNEIGFFESVAHNRNLRRKLRYFVRQYEEYRTYLNHPELNLPTTTNSAESLIRCVRDMLSRTRGFRSSQSLARWIRAYCLMKKTMTCNGKKQPN